MREAMAKSSFVSYPISVHTRTAISIAVFMTSDFIRLDFEGLSFISIIILTAKEPSRLIILAKYYNIFLIEITLAMPSGREVKCIP